MNIFFDNGTTDPDDNTPDSGTINIGCGSPTAVTFSSIDAGPALASPIAVGLVVAAVLGGAGLFIWKRRK
jgi:LPXTG-motif cell wall-anchored protein